MRAGAGLLLLALTTACSGDTGSSGSDALGRGAAGGVTAGGDEAILTAPDAGEGTSGAGGSASGDGGRSGGGPERDAGGALLAVDGSCVAGARFATEVVEHAFGTGQDIGQDRFPDLVLGGPRGAGCCSGSLDVVSLGNGGWVVLAFDGTAIVDGPGPDFVVFENAFAPASSPESPFAELATVSVSEDGETWHAFDCVATDAPYGDCAGWRPVYANVDENDVDPLDPDVSGGDLFDLADIGVERATLVRIVDRPDLDGFDGVFDLDAVGVINAACP